MKILVVVALVVLCAAFIQAKGDEYRKRRSAQDDEYRKRRSAQDDEYRKRRSTKDEIRSELEKKLRSFLNKRMDGVTDLPPVTDLAPAFRNPECASLTWMDLMRDHGFKNARLNATKDLFIEITSAALSMPPPPPFTFDDRLLKVVHFLANMGHVASVPEGERFLNTLSYGFMHLAITSIYDPEAARIMIYHSVKFMENGKSEYEKSKGSRQTTIKRGWEEESEDSYVDMIIRGMCDIEMKDINGATGLIRALRVIAVTEKARTLIGLIGEAIHELIRVYEQDPDQAKAIAAKWTDDMQKFGSKISETLQGASHDKRELSDKANELLDTLRRIARKLDK